ncbi:MAG: DsbA family protein [Paracoccaceae bacterium]
MQIFSRISLLATALLFAVSITYAADLKHLTDSERAALRGEIRDYLLENPDIIVEVIAILEQRRKQAEAEAELSLISDSYDDIFNDGYSYVGNNPEGDITIVEFLDYRCAYCKRAHADVQALLEEDRNIRYIVKEFPILGPESVLASKAAISLYIGQGSTAYEAFNDALMRFNGPINESSLAAMARKLGLDDAAMLAGIDDDEVARRIAGTRDLGIRLRVNGTPTFIIGSDFYRGFLTLEQMRDAVKSVRLARK